MSQDNVSPLDLTRSLPGILRRLPAITRGLYYYSLDNENRELTLGTLIGTNARNVGHRPAVLFEDRVITWDELNGWANRIARYLQEQGLTKGDAIAVFLENRPELLAVVAGAAKLGVACAMLNTSQKGKVLEHSIGLIEPKMVVVGEELLDSFEGIRANLRTHHPRPFQFLADINTLNAFGDAPEGYTNMAEQVSTFNSDNLVLSNPPR
ncbi:MAG: AMP-binding protein, partial [Pseudomonadota bacterium]|nr:AMP-binding protein [Pseudomonadota bacterium]